jgi:hypothetical protein
VIVREGIPHPDVVTIKRDGTAEQRVFNHARFVPASLLFGVTSVVNIAEDQNRLLSGHDARMVMLQWLF